MCCSLFPASFDGLDGTAVIFSLAFHPSLRRYVRVLVYQNTPLNLSRGPNAMLLHFPAKPMGPDNAIPTDNAASIAKDCVRAVAPPRPMPRGPLSFDASLGTRSVHVFASGIYHVVLAENPRDIPGALSRVPANKRPAMNQEIFDFYAEMYPEWPMALCCFDSREAELATPMMWWYEPLDTHHGFLPGLDAHDGHAPRLNQRVEVNHWAIFGMNLNSAAMVTGAGAQALKNLKPVSYTDNLDSLQRALLPTHVMGKRFEGGFDNNGDFVVPIHEIGEGNVGRIERRLISA